MKNENAEMISNRVRELIEAGKQKGALTIKEIIEQFADCEMEPISSIRFSTRCRN